MIMCGRLAHVCDRRHGRADQGLHLHTRAIVFGVRLVLLMPMRLLITLNSKSTCVSASGWHSGTSSDVRLAAMMPATLATASTSPLGSACSCSLQSLGGSSRLTPTRAGAA